MNVFDHCDTGICNLRCYSFRRIDLVTNFIGKNHTPDKRRFEYRSICPCRHGYEGDRKAAIGFSRAFDGFACYQPRRKRSMAWSYRGENSRGENSARTSCAMRHLSSARWPRSPSSPPLRARRYRRTASGGDDNSGSISDGGNNYGGVHGVLPCYSMSGRTLRLSSTAGTGDPVIGAKSIPGQSTFKL